MTLGAPSNVRNNHLSLLRAQMKLFYRSLDKNIKVIEKVKLVDVTPIISSNGNLHLLVL